MAAQYGSLGMQTDDCYRCVPEEQIVEMLMLAGWVFELESGEAKEASKKALKSWTGLGLGFRREANGEKWYDPAEVTNFLKRAGYDGHDNFWAERYITTGRRLVSDLAQADATCLSPNGERLFTVDFRRTFYLDTVAPGRPVRLRMPLPLEGKYLENLQVKLIPEINHHAEIEIHPGRIEARLTASDESKIKLGARLSFTARAQAPVPGDSDEEPDRELYLRPQEGLIVVSERIQILAQSLATTSASPLEKLRAFWDYINRELMCGMLHYDQVDAAAPCDWVLDSGWFDCQMGSALFVSLCRAHGIPARLVAGRVLYRLAPTHHYWAEAWIQGQGWTPFDFLSWDLSQGGRAPEWRDYFFGRIDPRIITERLPREFTGSIGVPIPEIWNLLLRADTGGVETSFLNGNGTPVYIDNARVTG